jgi:hypothetical protein
MTSLMGKPVVPLYWQNYLHNVPEDMLESMLISLRQLFPHLEWRAYLEKV